MNKFAALIPVLFIVIGVVPSEAKDLPVERAVLTDAPAVPPPLTRDYPARVIVELEVRETEGQLSDGVRYTFWTFGGKVPGKFIRVRQGDTIELHLANHPSSKLPHNIDLHAVTGPGGGASSTFTAPGHKSQFTFQAINPGLYVYHCATAPVGMHIANGMYGLIYVQPPKPLPRVDHEYYIMQSEFYTIGAFGEQGLQPFAMQKAIDENPSYVVFNGAANSLTGEKAITAKVGETVRLFVGNGGPNLISSFHVIGEIFDKVYGEGGTTANQSNVQSTLVPAGGSAIVDFRLEVPGSLVLVDHSIFRAFNKGALGMLKVSGPENKNIYSGKEIDEIYLGEAISPATEPERTPEVPVVPDKITAAYLIEQGKKIYTSQCYACHQLNGEGLPQLFPPLAGSDYVKVRSAGQSRKELVDLVVNGLSGKLTVNGKDYDSVMPAQNLTDLDTASVLTYITNNWGNKAEPFSADEVRQAKEQSLKSQKDGRE